MKNTIKIIILFSLLFALTSTVYAYSDGNTQKLLEFAEDFILESYSDFSTKEKSSEDFINQDAVELKKFIKDREEILNFYLENSKKDIEPLNSEVVESQIKDLDNSVYQVLLKINHEYLTTGRKAFMQVIYKIVIKDEQNPKVIAAMSNDISASYLFDDNVVGYNELNLDYQLKNQLKNKSEAMVMNTYSYNLNEVKNNLKKLLGTMEDDVKLKTVVNFHSGNFRYFTEADKDKMRRYQDSWYNAFNPNYYNFENIENMWDCTNYTSQVLAEVCPMKIS